MIVNILKRPIIQMAVLTICLFFVFSCHPIDIFAQVPPPITESGLNTQVSGALNVGGNTQYNITGGTRPSNGGNVFHSFGEFGVPLNNIANFQNDSGLPTSNILSRVTGNNPSNIFGTIQSEGFGDANFFLLNPNGVVFGPNASLDLNGSFHVSTANSIRLGTGPGAGLFSANEAIPDLLTSAPPSAFGFSGSKPFAGISVESTTLIVQPGKVISIIGGDANGLPQDDQQGNLITDTNTGVQLTASILAAPGGQINLVSVSASGTVTTTGPELTPDFPLTTLTKLGSVNITDESMVDVRGNTSGTVVIRGGRLILGNRSQITAATSGSSNAGNVTITTSENVMINDGSQITTSTIGRGSGNAGNVTINATGDVNLSGSTGVLSSQISSSAIESTPVGEGLLGSGGSITISAQNVTLRDGAKISVKSGELQSVRQINSTNSLPSAGTVKITAVETLTVSGANTTSPLTPENSPIVPTEITAAANGPAAAGTIRAEAKNIIISDGGIIAADINSMTVVGKRGTIALKAHEQLLLTGAATRADFIDPPPANFSRVQDNLLVSLSAILANTTGINPGAEVTIDATNLEITDGATINAISFSGEGQGGSVTINSKDTVLLSGAYEFTNNSGSPLRSRIGTETRANSKAGDIRIHAKNVELMDGAEISAISIGRGSEKSGGDVIIHATENLILAGITTITNTQLGNNQPPTREISSRITSTTTEGRPLTATALLGSGGDITVTGGTVLVKDGASIESKGFGNKDTEMSQATFIATTPGLPVPQTGNITIMADHLTVSGTRNSRVPSEISTGVTGSVGTGNLSVMANNISIRDGGRISAETESRTPGVARGNITLTAHDTLSISGGSKALAHDRTFTSSIVAGASGTNQAGDIKVVTQNLKVTDGGFIGTASLIGQNASFPTLGAAGSITITAKDVVLQDRATINSSATSIGEAGNITLQGADDIRLDGATLSTNATQSSGGNIKLEASDLIFLKDSRIESSVKGNSATKGGNISLDPEFIVVSNSEITATANEGAGGNIDLVAKVVFIDRLGSLDASAGDPRLDGSVNIQAPIQNLSQAIAPLPQGLVEVAALYSAKCAGQEGGIFSSFRQQGRDRLPFEPGELLPTPIFMPDLLINQSKRPSTSSSPMTQRLHLPGIDSAIAMASAWDISRSGCRS